MFLAFSTAAFVPALVGVLAVVDVPAVVEINAEVAVLEVDNTLCCYQHPF
jgi:hypothetical protein